MKKYVSMTISKPVWEAYKILCKRNGMKISTRVEVLIKKEIDNEIEK